MTYPFDETQRGSTKIRVFSKNVPEEELKWHWDEADRWVTILEDTDWEFQFDNELPIKLKRGQSIFIKAGEMHRVIKGKTDLVVEIKENRP